MTLLTDDCRIEKCGGHFLCGKILGLDREGRIFLVWRAKKGTHADLVLSQQEKTNV
jgi:hypothetical protein